MPPSTNAKDPFVIGSLTLLFQQTPNAAGGYSLYSSAFQVSGDGTHNVYFYSVDNAGNAEAVKSTTIQIDSTAPVTKASPSGTARTTTGLLLGNLGIILFEQGKIDEALTLFREAVRVQPDLPVSHTNLGSLLYAQGKLSEALSSYEQARRLDPGSTVAPGGHLRCLSKNFAVAVTD